VKRAALALAAVAVAGCNNLGGLGGPVPPLVQFQVEVTGDLSSVQPPPVSLQVALVWGAQWLTEPLCLLATIDPNTDQPTKDVISAGCRDPLGFVPARVAASVPVTIGTPTTLALYDNPSTDLLVGGITSRTAYASLVLYDDRSSDGTKGNGTLDLAQPHPAATGGRDGPDQQDMTDSPDIVYGASFVTMTAPDQRIMFLQGTFDPTAAFYPRSGCLDPNMNTPGGFYVLGASGFDPSTAVQISAMGMLPPETDPTSCTIAPNATIPIGQDGLIPTLISVATRAPADVQEVSCQEQTLDGSVRYRQPPADEPADFANRTMVCASVPSFDAGAQPNLTQLVVSGLPADRCKGLTHYTLRGCRESVSCAVPDWDFTANRPAWWPCTPP
jgi:hypothetical protein